MGVQKHKHLFSSATGRNGLHIIKFVVHREGPGLYTNISGIKKKISSREKLIENYYKHKDSDYYKTGNWSERIIQYERELEEQKLLLAEATNFIECDGIRLNKSLPQDSVWITKIKELKIKYNKN
jgi:hypothetical protein